LIALILLLGPLRHWVGRHWCLLASICIGGAFGWVLGAVVTAKLGCSVPYLPLLWAACGAVTVGRAGPACLRKIEKDGRD